MERLFKITIVLLLSIIIYLLIRLESSTPESDFKVIDSGGTINLIDMKSGRVYHYYDGTWQYPSKRPYSENISKDEDGDGIIDSIVLDGDILIKANPFKR